MKSRFAGFVAAALSTAAFVGCNSNAYDPKATDAELSSYAAQDKYPQNMNATEADNVFYSIGDNGVISLNNAGDRTLGSFDLWVNRSYVLMVDKLPAHNTRTFAPEKFFNTDGKSLKDEPVSQNWTVQIREAGRLMNVKGPVKM